MIEINAPLANCGSQSEFVEKAVRFYDGYLKVQNAGAFLPHAVADVLKGTLGVFANFIAYAIMGYPAGNMLQKYGYKKTALIAIAVGFTGVGIQTLRGGSVREVTSTRGMPRI